MVCDPSAANACIGQGATVAVLVKDDGQQIVEGLCPSCPVGVAGGAGTCDPERRARRSFTVRKHEGPET
ncbi:hypothetical protein [Anaeromyxobacter terrae]|uniref:hypothetical protein n=1 Tax=Anaeromyxobacter terrae TaxID=2925406 RepID=UPI001F597779|nr:hypothetical protein [Anaeromyxobacter sp. SG22]